MACCLPCNHMHVGELILEVALVDMPVAVVAQTALCVMGWLPFMLLRAIVCKCF